MTPFPLVLLGALVAGAATFVVARRRRRLVVLGVGLAAAGIVAAGVFTTHEYLRGERPFPGSRATVPPDGLTPGIPEPRAGAPLRFVAWGDARGGASVFARVREEIRARRPDFHVGLGDLVGMARRYQFRILEGQLRALGVPGYVIPGNHDLDPFGSLAPFESVFGPSDWRFDVRDVAFFGVDSAAGPVAATALARFVEGSRRAVAEGKRVVVFTHHPPFPPNGRPDKGMPDADPNVLALRDALQRARATVFSGNFHAYDRRAVGAVTQFVSGGAGSALETADGLHHLLVVTVTPTSLDVEKVDLPPRHETPAFADRWTTFLDEARWLAAEEPERAIPIGLGAGLALGAFAGLVRRRRAPSG